MLYETQTRFVSRCYIETLLPVIPSYAFKTIFDFQVLSHKKSTWIYKLNNL